MSSKAKKDRRKFIAKVSQKIWAKGYSEMYRNELLNTIADADVSVEDIKIMMQRNGL